MAKTYPEIDSKIRDWVAKQRIFFVSTAPLSGDGLVNCSPKGMDSFRILGPQTVAYFDLTGSGVETIAHLKENGRIVIMMCAFEGPPQIVRFHGKGRVLPKGTAEYDEMISNFEEYPGARAIIVIEVDRISDSCGYSVPFYDYKGERDTLLKWAKVKGDDGIAEYQSLKNRTSLDGLEGIVP
ncbi:pyridoxamine 5'-phosphate oxidase family protein [Haloferula chungangensis]|uniref:Pyridoxamine 5'-phosphate oxidase family protein n=1 Tax=Haloferula chungangensis TaxID=1048331 RepID=A0ABW2L966_9BACT